MAATEKRKGRADAEQKPVTVTSCVELANNAAEKVAKLRDAILTLAQTIHFRIRSESFRLRLISESW